MLSLRDRNRTLLLRQHLLERTTRPALDLVRHLIGLQAQDNLPPYLSLAARIEGFAPHMLSDAIESHDVVRILSMRGTIHVLLPDDALSLRAWVQPMFDQVAQSNQLSRPARDVPGPELVAAVDTVLADGPLPVKELGMRLAETFPEVPASALAHVARERAALVQMPPRGLWRRSGSVVYQTLQSILGREMTELDVPGLVRRYLAAFGPATAADMTAWSRVTRLGPVFAEMRDELVAVECEDGTVRWDVPGGPYADGGVSAPARLLGAYDNLWLAHADRSHIAVNDIRSRWMGANGGVGNAVLVDGFMTGLWWHRDGHVVTEMLRPVTRAQQHELDDEIERVESLLPSPRGA